MSVLGVYWPGGVAVVVIVAIMLGGLEGWEWLEEKWRGR